MSLITASLGFSAVRDIEREGLLVDRTFDRSAMSINFARAAAADFNGLQAAVARRAMAQDSAARVRFDQVIADLDSAMARDLSAAVEKAQSERVVSVADEIWPSLNEWKRARAALIGGSEPVSAWAALDREAMVVEQRLARLVNDTASAGFSDRESAHATILSQKRFNMIGTFLAVLVSGLIALLLSRRVVSPIRKASEVARRIADGDLGVTVPAGNADELGILLSAMEVMRQNIKASMERLVALQQSAQMRLADALEGSYEGIVVVDRDARIVLANAQASCLLDKVHAPLSAGDPADRLVAVLARTTYDQGFDYSSTWEVQLPAGRWLRVSKSDTREGGNIFVYSDISLFKEQQAELKNTNFWLDAALGNLSQGLCLFDSHDQLKVYNKRLCELLAYPADRIRPGIKAGDLASLGAVPLDQTVESVRLETERRIVAREAFDGLVGVTQGRMLAISYRPLEGNCWMATYEDVTERLQAADKIAYMARHDALTELPNRAFFAERIESALTRVDRGEAFALLCLDLDHFKEVNDTLGHPIGDQLLRTVAHRLLASVRDTDMVARLGGDEFAIFQSQVSSAEDVSTLAQRIIAALNAPCEIDGNPVPIGVSIGISMAPADDRGYDKLLKNADMALYRAKADGRNDFRFFERAMDERQQARRLIELDLREALARDQFEIDYQPVCDVAEDRIIGFEALVRWRHPLRGLVPPTEFIPIAEEMGLIAQIGSWVLRRACADAMCWPHDISVAINVSAAQLRYGALHDAVVAALEDSALAPGRLVLEITESVLIANPQNALLVLERFKAMGIRIAMDDFGTGYSSLSYLRSFPFDHVKIDKSFIYEITTRPEAAAIVRAVIALCTSLGMRTIAEGIETPGQLAFLKAEGCHEAQGYLFSRPMSVGAVPALLETQTILTDFLGSVRAA